MQKPVVLQVCNISLSVSTLSMLKHLNASLQKPGRIILLGGNGFIGQNLASILLKIIGLLNIAPGQSSSFQSVAQLVVKQFQNKVEIGSGTCANQMSHRQYDNSNLFNTLPPLVLTKIEGDIEPYQYRSSLNG